LLESINNIYITHIVLPKPHLMHRDGVGAEIIEHKSAVNGMERGRGQDLRGKVGMGMISISV